MKKVFIVHGFEGAPNINWFPWLMTELEKKRVYACSLPMPSPENPNKTDWVKTIYEAVGVPNEDVYLVGHSLGVPAILRYLETLGKDGKIGGAILVSGPAVKIEKKGYEQVNTFLETTFDFEHIKNTCDNFVVIHGDNDSIVSFSDAEFLSGKLEGSLVPVINGGHLNSNEGYYQLPQVLESLIRLMK